MAARFITFDGGEGAGKTTQIRRLAETLEGRGESVHMTREPGGCLHAEKLRDLLLEADSQEAWQALSQLYLLLAARHEHVESVIKPSLATGKWVLCDRFYHSTFAYQGYGGGLDIGLIEVLAQPLLQDLMPSATFLLDIDPEVGLRRIRERRGTMTSFDNLDLDYHRRVRQGFLELGRENKYSKTYIIDGERDAFEISAEILVIVGELQEGIA